MISTFPAADDVYTENLNNLYHKLLSILPMPLKQINNEFRNEMFTAKMKLIEFNIERSSFI